MEGKGKLDLPGKKEEVFEQLLDPDLLEESIIGCKNIERTEENKYEAELEIGIAAVKGNYDVVLLMEEVEYPNRCKLVVFGEGAPGTVEGEGLLRLVRLKNGNTRLKYTYTAEVGGKVASLAEPVLSGIAKLIISDFFKKSKKEMVKMQEGK